MRTCTVNGCEKPHRGRGLCGTHYAAWRRGKTKIEASAAREKSPRKCICCGEPIPAFRNAKALFCGPACKRKAQYAREKQSPKVERNKPCPIEGCGSPIFAREVCQKHYGRLRRTGRLDDTRKNARGVCAVDTCESVRVARGLCDKHYRRELSIEHRRQRLQELADRKCLHCDQLIPLARNSSALFCSPSCKEAERVASGRAADSSRQHYFRSQYGLTAEQIKKMAEAGCRICGTTEWPGRHNRPHVDHDHTTGVVRGILCSECNTGLGKFRDSPALLKAAIDYLLLQR